MGLGNLGQICRIQKTQSFISFWGLASAQSLSRFWHSEQQAAQLLGCKPGGFEICFFEATTDEDAQAYQAFFKPAWQPFPRQSELNHRSLCALASEHSQFQNLGTSFPLYLILVFIEPPQVMMGQCFAGSGLQSGPPQ